MTAFRCKRICSAISRERDICERLQRHFITRDPRRRGRAREAARADIVQSLANNVRRMLQTARYPNLRTQQGNMVWQRLNAMCTGEDDILLNEHTRAVAYSHNRS
jgi:hypothetical protein